MLQKQNYRMTQKPAPQNVSRSEIGVLKKQRDPRAHWPGNSAVADEQMSEKKRPCTLACKDHDSLDG